MRKRIVVLLATAAVISVCTFAFIRSPETSEVTKAQTGPITRVRHVETRKEEVTPTNLSPSQRSAAFGLLLGLWNGGGK